MKIKSVFGNKERIPQKYTCDGENISPSFEFIDIPKNAKSLALIIDDPDSSSGVFSHWVLFNIPPTAKNIKENSTAGGTEGVNDFGKIGYGGMCPHKGNHRYQFKLYALDVKLNLPKGSSKEEVENAIEGHIIDRVLLVGTYSRVQ